MRRHHVQLESPFRRRSGDVLVHGHFGRPVLAIPPAGGRAWDFDDNAMIESLTDLVQGGRAKIYCVDGRDLDEADERGARAAYDAWLVERVLPFIYADCDGPLEVLTAGCGDGAVSAAGLAIRRADLFPVAVCMSGRYDDDFCDSIEALHADHFEWIGGRVLVVLGAANDGADEAASAAFAASLGYLGIQHEIARVPDGTPCGWPAWRHLAATHLPRFC